MLSFAQRCSLSWTSNYDIFLAQQKQTNKIAVLKRTLQQNMKLYHWNSHSDSNLHPASTIVTRNVYFPILKTLDLSLHFLVPQQSYVVNPHQRTVKREMDISPLRTMRKQLPDDAILLAKRVEAAGRSMSLPAKRKRGLERTPIKETIGEHTLTLHTPHTRLD